MDLLANIVVIVHLAYFAFVVGGFLGIVIGAVLKWNWIFSPWFRIAHVLAILVVLVEDILQSPVRSMFSMQICGLRARAQGNRPEELEPCSISFRITPF